MIDKNLVWQRVGGKSALLQKIIKQFLDFYPGQVRVIEEAVRNEDEETLQRSCHRLRGAAANFEAVAVVQNVTGLEKSGQLGDWQAVRGHFHSLTDNLQDLHTGLLALADEASQVGV